MGTHGRHGHEHTHTRTHLSPRVQSLPADDVLNDVRRHLRGWTDRQHARARQPAAKVGLDRSGVYKATAVYSNSDVRPRATAAASCVYMCARAWLRCTLRTGCRGIAKEMARAGGRWCPFFPDSACQLPKTHTPLLAIERAESLRRKPERWPRTTPQLRGAAQMRALPTATELPRRSLDLVSSKKNQPVVR